MKHKTREMMRPVLEAYAYYQGSKKEFCEEWGIAPHTLDYWRRKFKEPEAATSGFLTLEVNGGISDQAIEVHYPNGIRVLVPPGVPAGLLQELLKYGG